MNKIKTILTRFPMWIFTILTVLLILWLTLAPNPLGDDSPVLFPGADKIVHGIMFGFLLAMILLDRQRKTDWQILRPAFITAAAAAAGAFGIGIEFIQKAMDMGRGFEIADMTADCTGVAICAVSWAKLQLYWSC